MMKAIATLALTGFLLCCAGLPFVHADGAADFYRGKTITLVVGSGAGGIYDIGARSIARHLGNFIDGNPKVIVENMPGASSVRAAGDFCGEHGGRLFRHAPLGAQSHDWNKVQSCDRI
jgi:tripartite-type tricarboxylate transporter receptor subunit TctC